jgi:hypothetical protein
MRMGIEFRFPHVLGSGAKAIVVSARPHAERTAREGDVDNDEERAERAETKEPEHPMK